MKRPIEWSYGVTTTPDRFDESLPRTLRSLSDAGFDSPRIFVDETIPDQSICSCIVNHNKTIRRPKVGAFGNWALALWELFVRNPGGNCRYVLFQDDILAVKNLRLYLERCTYEKKYYYNLCTYPKNEELLADKNIKGWYQSNQKGQGAQALMFDRTAVVILLSSMKFCARPRDSGQRRDNIDGVVSRSFLKAGWKELVHYPSLVDHVVEGQKSTLRPYQQPKINIFPGEEFDASTLA